VSGGPILSLTGLPQLILRFDVMVPDKWLYLVRLRAIGGIGSRGLRIGTLHCCLRELCQRLCTTIAKSPCWDTFRARQSGFNKTRISLGLRSLLEFQLRP